MSKLVVVCAGLAFSEKVRGCEATVASHPLFHKVLGAYQWAHKAPSKGALCARSATSTGIHQYTPLRLTRYTSSPSDEYVRVLVLPCYDNSSNK